MAMTYIPVAMQNTPIKMQFDKVTDGINFLNSFTAIDPCEDK